MTTLGFEDQSFNRASMSQLHYQPPGNGNYPRFRRQVNKGVCTHLINEKSTMASNQGKDIVHGDIDIDDGDEHNEADNDENDFDLKVGMQAYSEDEAYKLYNNYAISKGFSVRRGKKRYIEHTRVVRQQMFLCSCEGFSDEDAYKDKKVERLLIRTGCKARVIFKVENGVYELIQFISEHNHPFVNPEQRHLLRSAPKIMDSSAGVINSMSKYGIRARKAYSCLAREADGTQNARCFLVHNIACVLGILQKMQLKIFPSFLLNPGFKNMFTKLVHGCESEMEFESTWKQMIEEWGVGEDTWLKKLYDLRAKWCLAFSRDTFFANIGSTQGSERTNNVFQQMACKTMNLTDIAEHYEDSANRMRDIEVSNDLASAKP
ncbi:hypothetical protein F0562_030767 [Nyssa sinensis]|uniref:FAR1 domain-containing protein n=1 Tax=Nyssa sinensis TaxID=561372 RepID=A0A5J5B3H7_9ASTE|nr:hypothetical protein F0562_030767 [Nyssa sinensis]